MGGQRSQPVKSKGNQNCAWLVDQSVDEDPCDLSAASGWNEDAGVCGQTAGAAVLFLTWMIRVGRCCVFVPSRPPSSVPADLTPHVTPRLANPKGAILTHLRGVNDQQLLV